MKNPVPQFNEALDDHRELADAKTVRFANDPEALLDKHQAADFLKVASRTLEQWRRNGSGPPFVKLSHTLVRYRRADLIEYARRHVARSTSDDAAAG